MATELKTRKYTKEQMVSYMEKHGSNMTEAANIAGTSPRTLNRYLAEGVIPSEWYAKITAALKDRKPGTKTEVKPEVRKCPVCGKAIKDNKNTYSIDTNLLKDAGVEPPASGWHWFTNTRNGKKSKMYQVCEACYLKTTPAKRKNVVKGKIVTKKN